MSYKSHSYRILCEDRRHYYMIYSYLQCKGVKNRDIINVAGFPEGKGDAKQFIRKHYELVYREIKNHPSTILIIVRDADNETYESVLKEFESASGTVFVVIPKRNIETWFYFIDHQDLPDSKDEYTDRKKQYPNHGTHPTEYGEKLEYVINMRRNKTPTKNMPDSLEKTITALLEWEKNKI